MPGDVGRSSSAYEALLTESTFARKQKLASASPASCEKHLFTKHVGAPLDEIVKLWWSDSKRLPVSQSCPDWAFRSPCPHKIVFEAKFFRDDSFDSAQRELVRGIYQCFYYRAKPTVEPRAKRPGWDYDYACRFGKAVRRRRHQLGVSQEEFADMCGLDRTYIGGIERGERNIALVNIERIARAFRILLAELFRGL
jgi:DNA-binding XRE family transcriptional regulator